MAKGRCPVCLGVGRKSIPGEMFERLCPRCQGAGTAALDSKEQDAEFARNAQGGYRRSEQSRDAATPGPRPFRSGVNDHAEVRKHREEIRRIERRDAPACEPKPEAPASTPATDNPCVCGAVQGACSGACATVFYG